MEFIIVGVFEAGDLEEELVMLTATNDLDIGDYILSNSPIGSDGKLNKYQRVFRFPSGAIKEDNTIYLHTKSGKDFIEEIEGGDFVHHYYWNLNGTVWLSNEDKVYLQRAQD